MTVATAGKILSEEELRTYAKCSQLYHYGGSYVPRNQMIVITHAFERIVWNALRNPESDPHKTFTSDVTSGLSKISSLSSLLDGQIEELVRNSTNYLRELFSFFSLQTYIPITGPLPYTLRVSRTPINLNLSGTFRTKKNQTIHAVSFTPYYSPHAMENDPITHLKLASLRNFVSKRNNRAQAKLHIFGMNKAGQMSYASVDSNQSTANHVKRVEAMIKAMEQGSYYPLVPCPYSCPFKEKCRPE